MASLGTHPRLAHMMLKCQQLGWGALGCDLAALLGEKDLLQGNSSSSAIAYQPAPTDIRLRLEYYYSAVSLPASSHSPTAHKRSVKRSEHSLLQRIKASSERWQRQLKIGRGVQDPDKAGLLLCFAFPDRIAQRRGENSMNYRLRNGSGAAFIDRDALCKHPYIVATELDGKQGNARIFLAAPVSKNELLEHFSNHIEIQNTVLWDPQSESLKAREIQSLGAVVLNDAAISAPSAEILKTGLLSAIRQRGIEQLPWSLQARTLCARVELIRQHLLTDSPSNDQEHADLGATNKDSQAENITGNDWPDLSDKALLENLEKWLGPFIDGFRKLDQLRQLDFHQLLLNQLQWQQQQQLEQWLPRHYQVPSGSHITIDYLSRKEPLLSVRIQELFGLQQTPTLLEGKLPVTIQLLSPAQRPIQVTRDLASFWANTYVDVCKDLKGRYPKHYWPEDPYQAQATRGTKKQMKRAPEKP